jgi:hypothetical protein
MIFGGEAKSRPSSTPIFDAPTNEDEEAGGGGGAVTPRGGGVDVDAMLFGGNAKSQPLSIIKYN